MRLTLAMGVLVMLGTAACSNGSESRDPSAYYYRWLPDPEAPWVVYRTSASEALKAVQDWIAAHAVELKRAEELGPGDWMPTDFFFEAYADGSYRERDLMTAVPAPGSELAEDKPKGQLKWVPNLSAIDIEELRKIFQEHGERVDQLPEDWW
jgi:hypothetical protein